jgi:hypothetical protein
MQYKTKTFKLIDAKRFVVVIGKQKPSLLNFYAACLDENSITI